MATASRFKEATSVYLPSGTRQRIRELVDGRGETPATFMRVAILNRLRMEEADQPVPHLASAADVANNHRA